MTPSAALRILIAAGDDPVLAAWASVVHEHRMPANTEVAPYDHLEAFQSIYSYGFIGSCEYNQVDEKKAFFSGNTPASSDVQTVLNNLQILPERLEEMPNKPKFGAFKNQAALAPIVPNRGLSNQARVPLPGVPHQSNIQAFAPAPPVQAFQRQQAMNLGPNVAPMAPMPHPQGQQGLPCATPDPMMQTGLDVQHWCCGVKSDHVDVGGDYHEGDSTEDGNPFIEFSYHTTCHICGAKGCHAVEKPHPRGSFR